MPLTVFNVYSTAKEREICLLLKYVNILDILEFKFTDKANRYVMDFL